MFGYLLEACSFPVRDRKGVDLEERGGRDELGGAAEGETVIILYCMRKQPIFNKRENVFKEVQLY